MKWAEAEWRKEDVFAYSSIATASVVTPLCREREACSFFRLLSLQEARAQKGHMGGTAVLQSRVGPVPPRTQK